MSRITVVNHVTLDGVMQAPGGPDEDRRGGFDLGGWAMPNHDDVMGKFMGKNMTSGRGALLLGRFTYEAFASHWPHQTDDNPFTGVLNERTKYVASTTLREPLPWMNSVLLEGDVPDAVAKLKEEEDGDLVILGSGVLIRSLMARDLIDEFVLSIHPIVLGEGTRLFDGGARASLQLVNSIPTTKGVMITTYQVVSAG